MVPKMRVRPFSILLAAIALLAVSAGVASAHVLKAARAANANNFVAREVCRDIVDDPEIGTCVDWTSGPCRRLSPHRIRCQLTHLFRHENGMELRCSQTQEWFILNGEGDLRARPVAKSGRCRVIRPPEPAAP
jgi:hypothetical protein